MNALELLFADIYEYNEKTRKCENDFKQLKNFGNYLDDRLKQLTVKRTYTLKFPLNLLCKNKMIVDDLNKSEEITQYNQEINEYNSLLDANKALNKYLNSLQLEIGLIADSLTFDIYLDCCKDKYPEMANETEYNNIQDKLKGFKEYLYSQVK